jgi:hypothetical protein
MVGQLFINLLEDSLEDTALKFDELGFIQQMQEAFMIFGALPFNFYWSESFR